MRITSSGICGSDLHLYEVLAPFMNPATCSATSRWGSSRRSARRSSVSAGDRVVIPFQISCGHCFMCDQELHTQCETTQVREHGMGAALFGYTKLYGEVPGGQAELRASRRPTTRTIKVPEGPADERFLFLSDVLPTAWQAVEYADIPDGGSVAVLGLGPIGEMCARIACTGHRVIGVDLVPERLERAPRAASRRSTCASTRTTWPRRSAA